MYKFISKAIRNYAFRKNFILKRGLNAQQKLAFRLNEAYFINRFGKDVFEKRPFVNIGAGDDFDHPAFQSLDGYKGSPDFRWNACKNDSLPFNPNFLLGAYTSHMLEHLTNGEVRFVFSEVLKSLRINSVFRVVVPNIELAYEAWKTGDKVFFHNTWKGEEISIDEAFIGTFAQRLVYGINQDKLTKKINNYSISEIFEAKGMEAACDFFIAIESIRSDRVDWYNHCNWFSAKKIQEIGKSVGFRDSYISGFGQSREPIFRDIRYFDNTAANESLYVDFVK